MKRLTRDAQQRGADKTGICQSRNGAAVYEHFEVSTIECCRNGRGPVHRDGAGAEAVLIDDDLSADGRAGRAGADY